MMKYLRILLIASICSQSCGQNQTGGTAITNSSDKDANELADVIKFASKTRNFRSLIVSQNDRVIAEEYFDSFSADSLEHVRSVTKSVMTTLIGIALDKGIIADADESIVRYLGNKAKGKEQITVRHLMAMTSGIGWRETIGNMEIDEWINADSPLEYVLSKPITSTPGTKWEYSTGVIHLLSVILTKASGMSTLQFAEKHLFGPLGIRKVKWQKLNDGYYHGGSRLQLKPIDMLKLGQLFDNSGIYRGKRIVSAEFIDDATSEQQPIGSFGEGNGYGYGWWIGGEGGIRGYMAQGYGGQTIVVIPNHHIVIAITYKWKVSNQSALDQQNEALNVIASGVLKSILKL